MENNTNFTETFFKWASSQGINSKEIAKELGKKQILVSNWRSRGIPKNHQYACLMLMNKKDAINLLGSKRLDVVKILQRSID